MAAANATRINAEITKAQQTVIAKARDLLKDTKVDAIAPQEGNDYSQLYAMAAMYREALIAVEKYITIASGDEKFSVQLSAAQFASELKDPAKIVEHLSAIEPLKSQQALSLAVSTSNVFAQIVAEVRTPNDGLALIDTIDTKIKAVPSLTDSDRNYAKVVFAGGKIDILRRVDRNKEALAIAEATLPLTTSKNSWRIRTAITQLTLIGSSAPALQIDRRLGGFSSLGETKGRVVVLYFFAHWSDPSQAAISSIRKIYEGFAPSQVQIVGVTQLFGYFAKERKLSGEIETSKLERYKSDQGIKWPIVIGPASNFEKYGVTGLPYVVILDRRGVVHTVKIGFSGDSMKDLKSLVGKLVQESS